MKKSLFEELRGVYAGPRIGEWLLGLSCTIMLGSNIQGRMQMEGVQTGSRYYFHSAWAQGLQQFGTAIDVAVVLTCALWLAYPRKKSWWEISLLALCVLGAPVVWLELVQALKTQPNPIFVLDELPIRPINNLGLIGSSIFLLYVVSVQRFGKSFKVDAIVKLALGAVITLGQLAAFNALHARMNH